MEREQEQLERARDAAGRIATVDLAIVQAVAPYSDTLPVRALGSASELADQPPLIAASVLTTAFGWFMGRPMVMRMGLRMLAAHGLATAIKSLLKNNVDRSRPRKVAKDGQYFAERGTSREPDERSFPSGHSAGAFAIAGAIAQEAPAAAPAAYGVAAAASLTQIPRKAHFPSDVATGIAIGLLSGWIVKQVFALSER